MATVTKARRAQIQREAADIRARGQRVGSSVERIAVEPARRGIAEASIAVKTPYTPGWAAATLVLALAEANDRPADAALRALVILDQIPAARLRSTSRSRLARLDRRLAGVDARPVRDLSERLRVLPPPINEDGTATA